MKAAAIDLGKVRVGLAVADELGMLAHPRPHLDGRSPRALLTTLSRIADESTPASQRAERDKQNEVSTLNSKSHSHEHGCNKETSGCKSESNFRMDLGAPPAGLRPLRN